MVPARIRERLRESKLAAVPVVVLACMAAAPGAPAPGPPRPATRLWYSQPATAFEEALPLGDGRTGAMVYGGPASDRVLLNDSTLWTGGPIEPAVKRGWPGSLSEYSSQSALARRAASKFSS